ncbi:hypothetical protein C0J52_24444 [Blattella germanica]|nr:hypothetical protein C0J52_24444 [Blattella germanica]
MYTMLQTQNVFKPLRQILLTILSVSIYFIILYRFIKRSNEFQEQRICKITEYMNCNIRKKSDHTIKKSIRKINSNMNMSNKIMNVVAREIVQYFKMYSQDFELNVTTLRKMLQTQNVFKPLRQILITILSVSIYFIILYRFIKRSNEFQEQRICKITEYMNCNIRKKSDHTIKKSIRKINSNMNMSNKIMNVVAREIVQYFKMYSQVCFRCLGFVHQIIIIPMLVPTLLKFFMIQCVITYWQCCILFSECIHAINHFIYLALFPKLVKTINLYLNTIKSQCSTIIENKLNKKIHWHINQNTIP